MQQSALPRARGRHDRDHLSLTQSQVHIGQYFQIFLARSIRFLQSARFQDRFVGFVRGVHLLRVPRSRFSPSNPAKFSHPALLDRAASLPLSGHFSGFPFSLMPATSSVPLSAFPGTASSGPTFSHFFPCATGVQTALQKSHSEPSVTRFVSMLYNCLPGVLTPAGPRPPKPASRVHP